DPSTAFAISRLTDAGYLNQSPIGIFRDVERPTYDDQTRAQVARTQNQDDNQRARLVELLNGGDTWLVDE
ncbi:MAG: 2-oxoacid:ferredoxin oxidoreductase subunit beta, partial [Nocardioides sp.]|nr:2-oxoacid:ferredoxin oxidoreductase subunit beta [Nocardioides sp.]